MKIVPIVCVLGAILAPTIAQAVPQFAVRSARACNNCHVAPIDWHDPAIELRKCSLNCNTCHVNPTGGGLRTAAGIFYGREILPLWAIGGRPGDEDWSKPLNRPASQPKSPINYAAPRPNSAERYGGITSNPWWQLGFDIRGMAYFPEEEGLDTSVFPMQMDLHAAVRPYNPEDTNEGRVTLLTTLGFEGSRTEQFDNTLDRFFVKEWMAILHDLPYQLYAKAGRFLPAFGWRLDDHTAFIRQGQTFDNERQVTGVEVGVNPNYLYAHASVFYPSPDWESPIDIDSGIGTAWSVGYRDFFWQAGGSFLFENASTGSDVWLGANWSINLHEALHPWKWGSEFLPIIYLGEFDVRLTSPDGGDGRTGLTAFHEINVWPIDGINIKLRYDWQDPDIGFLDDHRHRYTAGLEIHPVTGIELILQYRFNDEPAGISNNDALIQIHGWF